MSDDGSSREFLKPSTYKKAKGDEDDDGDDDDDDDEDDFTIPQGYQVNRLTYYEIGFQPFGLWLDRWTWQFFHIKKPEVRRMMK